MSNGDDVCVVRKDLVGDRIDIFPAVVLRKVQFYQVLLLQRLAIGRIGVMLQKPPYNVLVVEDDAFGCAYGCRKGLEAQGAEVEG